MADTIYTPNHDPDECPDCQLLNRPQALGSIFCWWHARYNAAHHILSTLCKHRAHAPDAEHVARACVARDTLAGLTHVDYARVKLADDGVGDHPAAKDR